MKEELKIYLYRLWPVIVLVIGLPLLSFVIWLLIPAKSLDILVIDKTVKDNSYREHAGLFWTLDHLKYRRSSGEAYSADQDYLGFFPNGKADFGVVKDLTSRSDQEIGELVSRTNLIYLADTYGVYEGNFEQTAKDEMSKKVYGGMNSSDLRLVKMAIEQGKNVVAEFNSIASPTSPLIRTEFENLMGVKWTGWIGRYFDELDTAINRDIPTWMIRQYQRQHETWNLVGPGLIFIKESGEIEAFVYQKEYDNQVPLIRTQKMNKLGFHLPEVVPYPDWFDIMMIEREYEVISYYDINPTAEGVQKLRSMGLPRFFPAAVVRKLGEGSQYYFSGDFSDMEGTFGAAHFFGLPVLWRGLYVASDYTDRQSFYWNYYYPLISQVLEKVGEE
ncbi:hypothetical protein GCM10009119_00420 [Algoriphagus jejuensis]|uniref:Uncharacterized protein n=1 Tax=Algoriphagus jejuensis TaxID=419934 RepID=A0ABN1MVV2_9BACT